MKKALKNLLCIILTLSLLLSISSVAFAKSTADYTEKAQEIVNQMTLEEKVAQMILLNHPENSKDAIKKYKFGGYLLFASDFKNKSKKQVKNKIKGYQKNAKIKLLIGVDEEGGNIVRVSKYKKLRKTRFKSPSYLRQHGGIKAVKKEATDKAKYLKSLGINTNLAPVADTPYKKGNYIYNRAYSTNAKKNADFVKATVTKSNKENCITALKHFPGYGKNGNTHNKIITDNRSKKNYENRDLKPFKAGIKAGAPMILVNHDIVKCFDKDNTASLSPEVHRYMRQTLKYDGVIMTDSLAMKGAKNKYGDNKRIAVLAVKAGNDMLCTEYGELSVKAITQAVLDGEIDEEQINQSVIRILKMKYAYGIIK